MPPHRCHGLHHLIGIDSIPGECFGFDLNPNGGKIRLLRGFDVHSPVESVEDFFDLLPEFAERFQLFQIRGISAVLKGPMGRVNQHGDVGFHSRNQFIDSHFDWLRECK